MAKIAYIEKRFRGESLSIIDKAEQICREYEKDGWTITLRQLYYQFVSRGFLGNTQENYKRLGSIVNDARLAGMLDWRWLEDRTRNLAGNSHWRSPEDILDACARQFAIDKWANQSDYVEVWVEKEALAAVIERSARALDVSFFSCRGYVSQSEMHAAALRFKAQNDRGKAVHVIHLGDHDPSGLDMTRDIEDRMEVFGVQQFGIDRIALNMNQINQYNPPPNPAKATDARFADYQAKYGDESWELDALEPRVLGALIEQAVLKYRDETAFADLKAREDAMKQALRECSGRWDDVTEFLGVGEAARGLPESLFPSTDEDEDYEDEDYEDED